MASDGRTFENGLHTLFSLSSTKTSSCTSLLSDSDLDMPGSSPTLTADMDEFFECPVCFEYIFPPFLQCSNKHLVCSDCSTKLEHCPICRSSQGQSRNLAMEKRFFECPFCSEYMLPPFLQCSTGHLVCSDCRPKLDQCPTCGASLNQSKNLALGRLASNTSFQCKHGGCQITMRLTDMKSHEEMCEHRPYSCHLAGIVTSAGTKCKWLGPIEEVVPHLLDQHKSVHTDEGEGAELSFLDIFKVRPEVGVIWTNIQSCFDHKFLLVVKRQKDCHGQVQLIVCLRLIGTQKQAGNFIHQLELSGNQRKTRLEATTQSIRDSLESIIFKCGCIVMDEDGAKLMVENDVLRITLMISPRHKDQVRSGIVS